MEKNKSLISNYTFWYLILGLLLIFTLFLPFRIEEIEKGYSAGWFGNSSFHKGSIKRISGFNLLFPLIPIGFYLITFFTVIFSKKRVGKVFALIIIFFYLLSLLFVLFTTVFNLNFGTKREVYPGLGYYLMVLFSIIFIVMVIVQIKRTWNDNMDLHKKELDLLDVDLTD